MAEKKEESKSAGTKIDFASLGGLVLAIGGILAGLMMEGGKILDVAQISAAIIVFAGTFGAVMVTTPMGVLLRGLKRLPAIFIHNVPDPEVLIEEIMVYAT